MKKLQITCLLLFLFTHINAQSISAKYSVEQEIVYIEGEEKHSVATLSYTGYFFAEGNRFIFYKKPLYLGKYPEGSIPFKSANSTTDILLIKDTIQGLHYMDLDSTIWRYRMDFSSATGNKEPGIVRTFPLGFQKWEFSEEKKNISGLNCQKAIRYSSDGKKSWEVWFCPEIPAPGGPGGLTDLPGLVVEAYCIPWQEKYVLDAYDLNASISPSVFWPAEFNLGFKQIAPIKSTSTPSKTSQLSEISNQ